MKIFTLSVRYYTTPNSSDILLKVTENEMHFVLFLSEVMLDRKNDSCDITCGIWEDGACVSEYFYDTTLGYWEQSYGNKDFINWLSNKK